MLHFKTPGMEISELEWGIDARQVTLAYDLSGRLMAIINRGQSRWQ
jgi:hypothetical protein